MEEKILSLFKNVKTYLGILSGIVAVSFFIYRDTLNSGLLKDANELTTLLGFVFAVFALILGWLAFKEASQQETEVTIAEGKNEVEKVKAERSVIKGKGAKGTKARIKGKHAEIDASETTDADFQIDTNTNSSDADSKKK